MFKAKKDLWMIVSALAILVACFAPAAQAADLKLTVEVNEPFEFDGRVYPAGELRLNQIGTYSPVATLNEIVVDGTSLGLFIAQQPRTSTETADRDELIFSRSAEGHLDLLSVAVEGQPVREFFEQENDVRNDMLIASR